MSDLTPAQKIRAQSREATRKALLQAGLSETLARGGDIPSIDAIVERAGYTRGAFYFYFEDREHFVSEMLDWVLNDILTSLFVSSTEGAAGLPDVIERFNASMAAGDWPDVEGDIRSSYLAVLRELKPGSDLSQRHSELMHAIIARLEELVREGQAEGSIREDVDPTAVAAFLILSAIGSIVWSGIDIPIDHPAIGAATLALLRTTD